MTTDRVASGRLPLVVFALLVAATVAAFFVTQRLKREDPVVKNITLPVYVSPNGDGRKDSVKIGFFLPKTDRLTVSITDANDDEVRRLADGRVRRGRHEYKWNGRDASGRVLPDGFYYLRVVSANEGRGTLTRRGVQLVTKPPVPKLLSVSPQRVAPGAKDAVTIRFSGPSNPKPLFSVFRTDRHPDKPELVRRFTGAIGSQEGVWDERLDDGRPAPAGTYAFSVTVQNKARVSGSSPGQLPPTAAAAAPRTGVTVGGPALAPPLVPVRPGAAARIGLSGPTRPVRWSVAALLKPRKVLARGSGGAPALRVRVPRKSPTGVYLVTVRAGSGSTSVPLAVRGRAAAGARVLVVLPAITWQGLNPVDDDADGFPDTLDNSRSVQLGRPFASGRMPAGFGQDVGPLLRFLTRERLRYDLTTDVALAHGAGPQLEGHRGVVFAGSERWYSEPLDAALRAYVEGGGRAASFGFDAFRRTVEVSDSALAAPSPAQATNALGERTAPISSAAAPLVVNPGDTLGLFEQSDGFVGLFTRFEQSQERVAGADVLSAAGRDPAKPAFVAYRLGNGTVVRVGTPEWAPALSSDTEVAAVTTSLWSYLSR
jgi:flagellar hook assembly protein FlgD